MLATEREVKLLETAVFSAALLGDVDAGRFEFVTLGGGLETDEAKWVIRQAQASGFSYLGLVCINRDGQPAAALSVSLEMDTVRRLALVFATIVRQKSEDPLVRMWLEPDLREMN